MRKTQQDKPAAPKTKDKPRFIVTREYSGSQSICKPGFGGRRQAGAHRPPQLQEAGR